MYLGVWLAGLLILYKFFPGGPSEMFAAVEEELKVSFKEPLSLLLTAITVIIYVGLLLVYLFNRPDATLFNMSPPLLYTLTLWMALMVVVFVAAWKVWR
jgi:hypothetical protein